MMWEVSTEIPGSPIGLSKEPITLPSWNLSQAMLESSESIWRAIFSRLPRATESFYPDHFVCKARIGRRVKMLRTLSRIVITSPNSSLNTCIRCGYTILIPSISSSQSSLPSAWIYEAIFWASIKETLFWIRLLGIYKEKKQGLGQIEDFNLIYCNS